MCVSCEENESEMMIRDVYILLFTRNHPKRGTAEEPAVFLLVRGAPSFDMSRVVGEPAGHDLFSKTRAEYDAA